MERNWLVYVGALLLVCLAAYFAGEHAAANAPPTRPSADTTSFRAAAATGPAMGEWQHPVSSDKIRVEGFGAVGFTAMKELLQRVSDEQKQRWAEEIAAMQYGPAQRLAAISLYASWIQLDARAACESLRHFADPPTRITTIDAVIGAAPATALPVLAEMLRTLSRVEQVQLTRGLVKEWSSTDAAAAAEFLARDAASEVARSAISAVIAQWAQDDLPAARVWLEQSEAFGADATAVAALVSAWARSDLAAVSEYVRERAASPGSHHALGLVTALLYERDRDRAGAFIRSLPEAAQAPAVDALFDALDSSAHTKLPEAIDWAAQLPAGVWAGRLAGYIGSWISDDPAAATVWLKARPAAERARLIDEVVRSGTFSKPLVDLALSLPDARRRDAAVRALTMGWEDQPDEFREAVAALDLPPAEAAYLLRMGGAAR